LHVILRPDVSPEEIHVNLTKKVLTFLKARKIYICLKDDCNYFASEKMEYVRNQHNHASHEGIGPAFRPSEPVLLMSEVETYSVDAPEDQFA
jgi:hypothetical protein